jgi:hypothetical protein
MPTGVSVRLSSVDAADGDPIHFTFTVFPSGDGLSNAVFEIKNDDGTVQILGADSAAAGDSQISFLVNQTDLPSNDSFDHFFFVLDSPDLTQPQRYECTRTRFTLQGTTLAGATFLSDKSDNGPSAPTYVGVSERLTEVGWQTVIGGGNTTDTSRLILSLASEARLSCEDDRVELGSIEHKVENGFGVEEDVAMSTALGGGLTVIDQEPGIYFGVEGDRFFTENSNASATLKSVELANAGVAISITFPTAEVKLP